MAEYGRALVIVDRAILVMFTVELLFKLFAYRLAFFRSGWNNRFRHRRDRLGTCERAVFYSARIANTQSFAVTFGCSADATGGCGYRTLNPWHDVGDQCLGVVVLRRIRDGHQTLWTTRRSEYAGVVRVGWCVSVYLVSDHDPRELVDGHRPSHHGIVSMVLDVLLLPFIIITSFAVLNLFIGIIVDSMQRLHETEVESDTTVSISKEEAVRLNAKLDEILATLKQERRDT